MARKGGVHSFLDGETWENPHHEFYINMAEVERGFVRLLCMFLGLLCLTLLDAFFLLFFIFLETELVCVDEM